MKMIQDTLALYGASLNEENIIVKKEATGIEVKIVKGRIRFSIKHSDQLIMSGAVNAATVRSFVENFWYWKPL